MQYRTAWVKYFEADILRKFINHKIKCMGRLAGNNRITTE